MKCSINKVALKMKKLNLFSLYLLINLISSSVGVFARFYDDDYNEFSSNIADPHLDIQRNVKIKQPITSHLDDHAHKISESFEFRNDHHNFKNDDFKSDRFKDKQFKEDQFKDEFNDDFRRDPFKSDPFKSDPFKSDPFKSDPFKSDPFKRDPFKSDPFRRDPFKKDPFENDYFTKTDPLKGDDFKNDDEFKMAEIPKIEKPKIEVHKKVEKPNLIIRKKEPKNDDFNKSDSFMNEFNSNLDDIPRIPDFDFHEHDSWFERNRDSDMSKRDHDKLVHDSWFERNRDIDIPRRDREKLVHDYRQQSPRTPFRVPMIPVPTFYPQPFPIFPTPFIPAMQPMNRPQPAQNQQQAQNRPSRPQSNQPQQNSNAPNPGFYYPFYPMMMPHSIPNQANSQNSNVHLQNALNSMMNRNSFLGFVDPLIIVAIIAIPVIAMLGFSSVVMPFIPVIIYVLNIFFPVSAAVGRKKRSIALDKFCSHLNKDKSYLIRNDELSAKKLGELELILNRLHRTICKFHI